MTIIQLKIIGDQILIKLKDLKKEAGSKYIHLLINL